jgi:hypothetical protein
MISKLLLIALLLNFANICISQSGDEILREANPESEVINNSPRAIDWKAIVEARKSENVERYQQLLRDYRNNYPESFFRDENSFNEPFDGKLKPEAPFITDWANGDNLVSPGGVPNPGIFERNLRLNIDSSGTQYCAYISTNRDTLAIYRSTDGGVHWTRWRTVLPGGTTKWHSFDMYITDSTGGHRIGFIGCRTTSTSTLDGQAYWFSYTDGGTFQGATLITPTLGGRGHIDPSIVSDGRDWSPGATYWYVAFRSVDASSGVGDSAVTSNTVDWGQTWETPRRVRAFDDYDLDIDYNFRADSIYVLLTNAISASNPNLRLMRTSLANFGSGTWTQFNVAGTADPEDLGEIAVGRDDNSMAIVYTRQVGATDKIYYNFWEGGGYWNSAAVVFNQSEPQSIAALDCNIGQWAWRMCFQVNLGTDTVVYMNTTSLSSGFGSRQVVSNNSPTGTVGPDVAGFTSPSSGGGVVYAQFGATPIWYDNSNIVTGIISGTEAPQTYELSQNYPNPFNPTTSIKYNIPGPGFVELIVFDALGREIAKLVNGNIEAGSHSVDFNAGGLPSGIYFYRISSGDFTDIKKMMLVK